MKLVYIRKITFNINGTTIHLGLAIPLHKSLKTLNDEKCDTLINTYDQLRLVLINEISLLGNKMFSFIDHRLHVIKQVHKELMGDLDVIMVGDFYQAPPIRDSWIFKSKTNEFDIFEIYFWHENIKCYKFIQIMR
jgi:hypothetical protein